MSDRADGSCDRDKREKDRAPTKPKAENGNCREGGLAGYMTAEAAMIVPAVFALIIMLLYLMFFLYDRCVMTQDLYMAAYRVSIQRGEKKAQSEAQSGNPDTSGYFMLSGCSAGVSGGREIRAFAEGSMVPAIMMGISGDGESGQGTAGQSSTWTLSVSMKARKTDPPFSFRRFRRVMAIARTAGKSLGLAE